MRKIVYVFLVVISLLFVAGCGKENIMDIYSFGEQQVNIVDSKLTITVPFGIAKMNTLPGGAKLQNNPNKEVAYMGADKNMTLIIVGRRLENDQQKLPLEEVAKQAIERTKSAPSVSNLTYQVDPVTIENIAAEKMHLAYLEKGNKQSVNQYIFYDKDVLWNVIYLYHTDNDVSEDLAQYLDGKIKVN